MVKKTTDSTKKKGKKKKVVKTKEIPTWGDPDCKSFCYHPVTGKPLNPFPNLREQESIIPFFSEIVEQKKQEIELKKKKELEESQAESLYRPITMSIYGENKNDEEPQLKPKIIKDLHRFEWMNKESWIRCRLRQKGWSYNDMFLNVQCSWTLLRLKMEIKKHLFEGSLLLDNILIYKNDLSKIDEESETDEDEDDTKRPESNSTTNNSTNTDSNNNDSKTKSESEIEKNSSQEVEDKFATFSKNQECNEPLYKLFPRINNLKSIGNMIPFDNGYTRCEDNEYPILVIGQRPIRIYEPSPPPPPTPAKPKVAKKKKEGAEKKKSSKPKSATKKKKSVKKSKKIEEIPPPEENDPNAPHEPNDSELLDMKDDDIIIFTKPDQILKNPNQYLYVFFDVNSPFVPSSIK